MPPLNALEREDRQGEAGKKKTTADKARPRGCWEKEQGKVCSGCKGREEAR